MNQSQLKHLKEAKECATARNGQCLSDYYIGAKRELIWKCQNIAHREWNASYYSVVLCGSWCKMCSK
jgi:hypothetical protein